MLLFGGQSFDVKNISILTASVEYMISAKRFNAPLYQNWQLFIFLCGDHFYLLSRNFSFIYFILSCIIYTNDCFFNLYYYTCNCFFNLYYYTCNMHTRNHTHIHTWPTPVNTSPARVNLSPSLIVATVTVKKQNLCTANENIGFMCYSLGYQLLITTSSIFCCICHSVKK